MMNVPTHTAKHLREVYVGGNWTSSALQAQLADLSWLEATTQIYDCNTIATLVYHMTYYVSAVLRVLQGHPLEAKDAHSFAHPPIESQADWEQFLAKIWQEAETFAQLVEQLPEARLWEEFSDPQYGSYYRNLHGIIEHIHYHLGQIVVIKKIIRQMG